MQVSPRMSPTRSGARGEAHLGLGERRQVGRSSGQRWCPSCPFQGDRWWLAPVDFCPRRRLGEHPGTSATLLDQATELGWVCFGFPMAAGCNEGGGMIFLLKASSGGKLI
jgi:hypothetical protein